MVLREGVISDMVIDDVKNPDVIKRFEQLQAQKLELNKLISDTKVKHVQITKNSKNLPSWVESTIQIRNKLYEGG